MAFIALDQTHIGETFAQETDTQFWDDLREFQEGNYNPGEVILNAQNPRMGLYETHSYDEGMQPQLRLIAYLRLVPSALAEGEYELAFELPLPGMFDANGMPETVTTSLIPVRAGEVISAYMQEPGGNALQYTYATITAVENDPNSNFPQVVINLAQQEEPQLLQLGAV